MRSISSWTSLLRILSESETTFQCQSPSIPGIEIEEIFLFNGVSLEKTILSNSVYLPESKNISKTFFLERTFINTF